MTVHTGKKQTDVVGIEAYSVDFKAIFVGMTDELNFLLERSATFEYNGKNARNFKENTVLNAKAFITAVQTTNESMATAISARTAYVTENLGGQPVTVTAPDLAIVETPIVCDDNIETAVQSDFDELKASINTVFDDVVTAYQKHDGRFNEMGDHCWQGDEFVQTSGEVAGMTGDAIGVVNENRALMLDAITAQMTALGW